MLSYVVVLLCLAAGITGDDSLSWIESSTKLDHPSSGFATGYNGDTDTIWLLGSVISFPIRTSYILSIFTLHPTYSLCAGGAHDTDALYEFDVSTSTFTTHSSLPIDLGAAPHTTANQKIYMAHYNESDTTHYLAVFDMQTKSFSFPWNDVAIPSYGAYDGCMTSYGDRYLIYVGGCTDCTDYDSPEYSDQILIYDLSNEEWLPRTKTMASARSRFGCAVHGDWLYVAGGEIRYLIVFLMVFSPQRESENEFGFIFQTDQTGSGLIMMWCCCLSPRYYQQSSSPGYTEEVDRIYIGDLDNLQDYDWTTVYHMNEHKVWTQPVVIDDFIYIIGMMYSVAHPLVFVVDRSSQIDPIFLSVIQCDR